MERHPSHTSHSEPTAEQLKQWDRHHVWHSFTQMAEYEPLIIDRAQGCVLTDIDGNQYLDGVSSLWCNLHGHRHPKLDEALRRQLDHVAHVTSLGCSNTTTVQLARRLVSIAPNGLEHVFFSSDGASAVEVALKMAYQYWRQITPAQPNRTKFIALHDAYHGDTLGSVSVGGVARFHDLFQALLFDVVRLPTPQTYRLPDGVTQETATSHYLQILQSVLEQHHHEVAALIIEPLVQCAAGMIMHPEGLLRGIRDLTRRFGILMIADEVAVGFGRTGTLFACQQEDVEPDLLCLGKGLTAGYLPMSATLATNEIWNAFLGEYSESKSLFHGHTFSGNPLCSAVALANLDVFESERTLQQLPGKVERLAEHLQAMRSLPHVGDVRQRGMIGAIELVRNRETGEPFPWEEKRGIRVCQHALTRGVWLRPLGNVIVLMPPLSVSLDQLDQICLAARHGIEATLSGG